jgi:hypothetical protein
MFKPPGVACFAIPMRINRDFFNGFRFGQHAPRTRPPEAVGVMFGVKFG